MGIKTTTMKLLYKIGALVFILLVVSNTSVAQRRNFSQEADVAYEKFQYNLAADLYKKAYTKVKKNRVERNRILFRIAECYRLSGNNSQALKQYQRLERINYQKDSPIVLMHIGDLLRMNKDYAEALKYYKKYKDLEPRDSSSVLPKIKSCELSSQWVDNPTRHVVENFRKFNSRENDWAPAWGNPSKKNVLFITSTRDGSTGRGVDAWTGQSFSDIWEFEKPRSRSIEWPGEWVGPKLIDESGVVLTSANEGEAVANNRGTTIYYTFCANEKKTVIGCKIYVAQKRGKSWRDPEMLVLGPDSFDYVHPAISDDEMTLYFSTNRPGGEGGFDIWVAKRSRKNRPFDEITNLGPIINTSSHEMFPTLRDEKTLYFSSKGHPGLGGFDMFVSKMDDNDEFLEPENLQYPMNSEGDDMGIIFDDSPLLDPISNAPYMEKGYFSSNRKGGRGGDDIYFFKLRPLIFTLSGIVRDSVTMQVITEAEVAVTGSDGKSFTTKTDNKGYYFFSKDLIQHNVTYDLSIKKSGYYEDTNNKGRETTVGLLENKDLKRDFRLIPIPKDPIVLPDILYDLGRWELKPQYEDSLAGLFKIMTENPTFVIELRSHTDVRPIPMTNDTLSQRRAESCVNYLVNKGINPDRLVAKGYGEKVPRTLHRNLVSNYGGQDYTFSMGTVLTPEYISALNGRNNQEAAHSLNRRTEFRILRDDFVPPTSTDSVDKTAIVQFIGTPGVSIINIKIEGDLVKIPCIINSRTSEFSIENNSNKISFSHEEAIKLLKENRLSTADFEEKEAAFSPDGSIIEKSVLYLENLRIGEEDIENVTVEVVKGLKTTLVIGDKMLTEEFGKFEIDKEKKTITITKNSN